MFTVGGLVGLLAGLATVFGILSLGVYVEEGLPPLDGSEKDAEDFTL